MEILFRRLIPLFRKYLNRWIKKISILSFSDLPSDYSGESGSVMVVNGTEDGFIFTTSVGTDEKVKASGGDPTAGYLSDKVDDDTVYVSGNELKSKLTTVSQNAVPTPVAGESIIWYDSDDEQYFLVYRNEADDKTLGVEMTEF